MGLSHSFHGIRRIALDTNCFIYYIEGSPWSEKLAPIFSSIETGEISGVTSSLTLLETLVQPIRQKKRHLADLYRQAIMQFPHLTVRDVDTRIAYRSAELRAEYPSLKSPDAIQLATALIEEASAFLTNDIRIPDIEMQGLRIIRFEEL